MTKPTSYVRKTSDPIVVRAEQVYEILKPMIEAEDRKRRLVNGDTQSGLGGIALIADQVGLSSRRVRHVLFEQTWVGFGTADQWLTAVGMHYRVRELRTYPNPRWNLETWLQWQEENGGCIG